MAKLLQFGAYTHKFQGDVNGTYTLFEVDEERNYRAIVNHENADVILDLDLLKSIAKSIEDILQ